MASYRMRLSADRQLSSVECQERQAVRSPHLPGRGLSPGTVLSLQGLAGNAAVQQLLSLQRQTPTAGGTSGAPSGLSCPVSTGPPPEVGTAVIFARGGAAVDPDLEKVIAGFLKTWDSVRTSRRAGVGDDLVVDAFASTTGSATFNWKLCCRRAEAVRTALRTLAGSMGLPVPKVDVLAHGPTKVFDATDPLRNQRTVITPVNPDGYRGIYTPPAGGTFPGLGVRKQALTTSGGTLLDMAVAMLETEHMDASDYPLGDGKIEDAANFGIFKQNWHYIRTSGAMPEIPSPIMSGLGLSKADWMRGVALNTDLALDVRVLQASQTKLGLGQWFAAHRWGETGQLAFQAAASGPTTAAQRATLSDIANYQNAVEWIRDQLAADPALRTDDRKVFVQVPAV